MSNKMKKLTEIAVIAENYNFTIANTGKFFQK
jgi:hypothetical protein